MGLRAERPFFGDGLIRGRTIEASTTSTVDSNRELVQDAESTMTPKQIHGDSLE